MAAVRGPGWGWRGRTGGKWRWCAHHGEVRVCHRCQSSVGGERSTDRGFGFQTRSLCAKFYLRGARCSTSLSGRFLSSRTAPRIVTVTCIRPLPYGARSVSLGGSLVQNVAARLSLCCAGGLRWCSVA
jgi:hypothetical protein